MSGANWPVRRSGGVSGSRESPWTFESERRWSSDLGGGSVDGGAGHCPDARGAAVQAACGLLGSGEDADGREHLPLPDTVAAGLPGSVECRRCVSTGSRNTNKEALLPDDGGRVDGDGCGGWRGAAAGCGAEDGTLITPLGRMRVCGRLAGCSLE